MSFKQPNDKTLIFNRHAVEFEQRIVTIIPLSDRVIVHLKTADLKYGDKLVGRNLLAYGLDGNKLWRVADHGATLRAGRGDTVTTPNETGDRRVPQSIFGIYFDEEDATIVEILLGWDLTIDPENGDIVEMEQRR